MYKNIFEQELANPATNYFILDTKGTEANTDGDIDFIRYGWERSRFNKINSGDLFICRRPGKSSETGSFYFFGAAKMGCIEGEDRVIGEMEKSLPFQSYLNPDDLNNFDWKWKTKGNDWQHFFNQYGMNQIPKEDFIGLMDMASIEIDDFYDPSVATQTIQDMQNENYRAEDEKSVGKKRTRQGIFANKVKSNYNNECAICKVRTKSFLIGSHIIPWSKNKDIRLDPANGLCLCTLHDRAFDKGYITVDHNGKVKLSTAVEQDEGLLNQLREISGKKIKYPKKFKPKTEYLEYHFNEIFIK